MKPESFYLRAPNIRALENIWIIREKGHIFAGSAIHPFIGQRISSKADVDGLVLMIQLERMLKGFPILMDEG